MLLEQHHQTHKSSGQLLLVGFEFYISQFKFKNLTFILKFIPDDSSSSSSSEPDLIELSGDDEPDVVFVPIDSQISDSRVEQVDVGRKLSASENCRTDEIVNLFDVPPSVSHLEPQNR